MLGICSSTPGHQSLGTCQVIFLEKMSLFCLFSVHHTEYLHQPRCPRSLIVSCPLARFPTPAASVLPGTSPGWPRGENATTQIHHINQTRCAGQAVATSTISTSHFLLTTFRLFQGRILPNALDSIPFVPTSHPRSVSSESLLLQSSSCSQ